jgi:hypothetical protein
MEFGCGWECRSCPWLWRGYHDRQAILDHKGTDVATDQSSADVASAGIVSEGDVWWPSRGAMALEQLVGQVMSRKVVT